MAQKKMELSRDTKKAQTRIASLQGIDEHLDLGNGLSLEGYRVAYQQSCDSVSEYNALLSLLLEKREQCKLQQRNIRNWNNRMKAGVAARFGIDSVQYEQAGGVRKVVRKKKNGGKAGS